MSDEGNIALWERLPIGGKHRQGPLKHSLQDRVLLPALPYQEQNTSQAVWEMWVWPGRWGRRGSRGPDSMLSFFNPVFQSFREKNHTPQQQTNHLLQARPSARGHEDALVPSFTSHGARQQRGQLRPLREQGLFCSHLKC